MILKTSRHGRISPPVVLVSFSVTRGAFSSNTAIRNEIFFKRKDILCRRPAVLFPGVASVTSARSCHDCETAGRLLAELPRRLFRQTTQSVNPDYSPERWVSRTGVGIPNQPVYNHQIDPTAGRRRAVP